MQALRARRAVLAGRVKSAVDALALERADCAGLTGAAIAAHDAAAPELARRARAARCAHLVPLNIDARVAGLVRACVAAHAAARAAAAAVAAPEAGRAACARAAHCAACLRPVLVLELTARTRLARCVAVARAAPLLSRRAAGAGGHSRAGRIPGRSSAFVLFAASWTRGTNAAGRGGVATGPVQLRGARRTVFAGRVRSAFDA